MIIDYYVYDKVLVAQKQATNSFLRSLSTLFFYSLYMHML